MRQSRRKSDAARMEAGFSRDQIDLTGGHRPGINRLLTIRAANSAHLTGAAPGGESGDQPMSITDLPVLAALRTKMQWHQERQRVLAENVSNSDTPNFKPRDLVEPKFDRTGAPVGSAMGSLAMMRTSTSHMVQTGGGESFSPDGKGGFQTRPAGNAVNLEDEMLKVSANQMDYAAATSLYSKSLHLIKTAIGKG
jgi:flagellar basal-body rod protein FlgB